MTQEEIKELSDKIKNGDLSPAQKLELLKELNKAVEGIRADLAELKN